MRCTRKKINFSVTLLIKIIEQISKWSGQTVAWLAIPLVVVMVYEVIVRKFFSPTIWAYELSYMLYGTHFMLGAAYCLYRQKHVRTDVWYGRWSPRTQGLVDSILYILLFLPGMVFFFWLSWDYFYEALLLGERSTFSPWRPIIYPFYGVVPLSVALLLLQGIAELLKSLRRAQGKEVPTVVPEIEVRYDET
jgi:TRAP-type mannitol/chloroaromatic compound transport system permease small subunit